MAQRVIATASKRQRRLRLPMPAGAYERMMLKVTRKVIYADLGECWLFNGARDQNGHGNVRIKRKRPDGSEYWSCDKAHRVSHEHHFGPIPKDKVVRHSCDVANCVRPEHVSELGSQADNVADMMARNRGANGYGRFSRRDAAEVERQRAEADDCPF